MLGFQIDSNSEGARLMLFENRSKSRTRTNVSQSRYVSSLSRQDRRLFEPLTLDGTMLTSIIAESSTQYPSRGHLLQLERWMRIWLSSPKH